ncbi:hypothetical protein D3C71_1737740 [compost metagenome]
MQAITSILAVVIAIGLPVISKLRDDGQKRKDRAALLLVAKNLALHAERAMTSSTDKLGTANSIPTYRLRDVRDSFHVLLAKDLPEEAIPPILEILCEVAYQVAAIRLYKVGGNRTTDLTEKARIRLGKVTAQVAVLNQISS